MDSGDPYMTMIMTRWYQSQVSGEMSFGKSCRMLEPFITQGSCRAMSETYLVSRTVAEGWAWSASYSMWRSTR